MTAVPAVEAAESRARSPVVVLAGTVAATTVVLGVVTGVGPLVGPLSSAYGVSTGAVSLVLSTTLCVALGLGLVTGPVARRVGPRRLLALAALGVPAGLVAAAVGDDVVLAGAALTVGVGGGAGCVIVPMTAAVGTVFERGRGAALVVATSGGALATVATPPATVAMLHAAGPRGALLTLAAVSAVVLGACTAAAPGRPADDVRPDGPARSAGITVLLAETGFRRLAVASVALTAAMFVPVIHLPGHVAARGSDLAAGAALLTVAGAASLLGRLVAVPAVARWGAWPVFRTGAVTLAGALCAWPLVDAPAGFVAFAVAFGLGHGAYVGLAGAVTAALYGVDALAPRLGVLHAATALGGLIGPAGAGAAVDLTGRSSGAVLVAAALGLTGVAVLTSVRPCADVTSG